MGTINKEYPNIKGLSENLSFFDSQIHLPILTSWVLFFLYMGTMLICIIYFFKNDRNY